MGREGTRATAEGVMVMVAVARVALRVVRSEGTRATAEGVMVLVSVAVARVALVAFAAKCRF